MFPSTRRVRTASGKHTITVYEDTTEMVGDRNHERPLLVGDGNPRIVSQPVLESELEENHLYNPVAEYKYDENEMIKKLDALEKLSHSIRSATPSFRSASGTTTSHTVEDDPFMEYGDAGDTNIDIDFHDEPGNTSDAVSKETRKVSDTFSEMPPELEMPGTYGTPTPLEEYLTPVSHRKPRHRFDRSGHDQSSSTSHETASIMGDDNLFSAPRTPVHDYHRSSAFRNPSSVRAMQMSSPSPPPFAVSPRSARHRNSTISRNSTPLKHLRPDSRASHLRDATPTRSPLSQHPNPAKEYPLVLLHCSVAAVTLPYSQSTLQAVLPAFVLEDIILLREKLTTNILERGVLISHPGEDYELLEERVLESLELKRPRLGKCGHFHGPDDTDYHHDANVTIESATLPHVDLQSDTSYNLSTTNPSCQTCSRAIADPFCTTDLSHCGPDEIPRRWDLKVYAANGLLRAGAWTAAWREMEKVDLEIGVWIPDDMRRALEIESEAEYDRRQNHDRLRQRDHVELNRNIGEVLDQVQSTGRPTASRHVSTSTEASIAACSKRGRSVPSVTKPQAHSGRIPLSALLGRYIRRKASQYPEVIALLIAVFLGLSFLLIRPTGLSRRIVDFTEADHIPSQYLSLGAKPLSHLSEHLSNWHDAPVPQHTVSSVAEALTGLTHLPSAAASSAQGILASASASASTALASATNAGARATDALWGVGGVIATASSIADGAEASTTASAGVEEATGLVRDVKNVLEAVGIIAG